MATIDDLVKATRSKRVQVADLPDAPKLQPTVRSGGQYTVAVQQAGKNKLMDLADALSTINPMLKDYKGIADLELEQYQTQLASLPPEELQAQLKKTTDELDRASRKGGIFAWAMSPINEKRKRRALGKAAYNQFELAAMNRLNTPIEGDRDLSTAAIVDDEYKKFIEANPALQGQYANEGFTEAVNPLINRLSRQYDLNKAAESQKEVSIEAVNSMIRMAQDASKDAFDIDMRAAVDDLPDAKGIIQESPWNSLNAMSPAMQRAAITSVAKSLANMDPLLARRFVNWSKTELKVGNALYGTNEAHISELEALIDDVEEGNQAASDKERDEFINDVSGELKVDLLRLERSLDKNEANKILVKNAQGEEVEVGSKGELEDIYKERALALTNISPGDQGRIIKSFDKIFLDEMNDGEDIAVDRIYRYAVDANPQFIRRRFEQDKDRFLMEAQVSEATKKHPKLIQLANEYARMLDEKVAGKLQDVIDMKPRDAATALNEFTSETYTGGQSEFKDAVLRLAQNIEAGAETADAGGLFVGAELPKPGEPYPTPDSWYMSDSNRLKDIYEKSNVWYAGAAKGDKEAIGLIQKYMPELEESYGKAAAGGSDEDRQKYFQVARFMDGIFTLDVLENRDDNGYATLARGVRFKPEVTIGQQNAGIFVLTTEEQLNTKDDPKTIGEIERIMKAIDFKGDRLDFIRAQEELRKRIGSTLMDYKTPPAIKTPTAVEGEEGVDAVEAKEEERVSKPRREFGTSASRVLQAEEQQKQKERSDFQSKVIKTVSSTAKELGMDSSVFNFDTETMGDSDRWGTLITTKGGVFPFGGIFERPPSGYAGMMTYKQFRGAGKRQKLLYSQPIPINEFAEKINSPEASRELGLTQKQVEEYKKLFNAADKAYTNK